MIWVIYAIWFVCGFLCCAWIHFQRDRQARRKMMYMLSQMSIDEIREQGRLTTEHIIKEKKDGS